MISTSDSQQARWTFTNGRYQKAGLALALVFLIVCVYSKPKNAFGFFICALCSIGYIVLSDCLRLFFYPPIARRLSQTLFYVFTFAFALVCAFASEQFGKLFDVEPTITNAISTLVIAAAASAVLVPVKPD